MKIGKSDSINEYLVEETYIDNILCYLIMLLIAIGSLAVRDACRWRVEARREETVRRKEDEEDAERLQKQRLADMKDLRLIY